MVITRAGSRPAAARRELALVDIDQGNLRAFLQQQPDTGQADAPGTAGHDAHFAVDLSHVFAPGGLTAHGATSVFTSISFRISPNSRASATKNWKSSGFAAVVMVG